MATTITGAGGIIDYGTGGYNLASQAKGNYKYPLNMFSSNGNSTNSSHAISPAYIKFNVLEAIRDDTLASTMTSVAAVGAQTALETAKQIKALEFSKAMDATTSGIGKVGQTIATSAEKILTSTLKTKETGQTVCLYMPPAIQINDSMAYDTVDTKGLSEVIASLVGSGGSTAEQLRQGGGANLVANHLLSKYSRTGGLLSGAVAKALIASGEVANPATKLLFRGPALRQIQLDFRLVPNSQAEAMEIMKIISVFRQAAYPGIDPSSLGALYTIPNLFNIKFAFRNSNSRNPYMIHYKRCYLTQVTTTYNGSGVAAFYKDGSPIETNLTLTFQETETNTAFDIHGSGNEIFDADLNMQQAIY